MPVARSRQFSLRAILLCIFLGALLLSQLIFAAFTVYLIFSRITTSEMNLLDRSITIHWQEYNRFFSEERAVLRTMANDAGIISCLGISRPGQKATFPSAGESDFRLLVDRHGFLAASDFKAAGPGKKLIRLLAPTWEQGRGLSSWERLCLDDFRELLPPSLMKKAEVYFTPSGSTRPMAFGSVLAQIVAVPVFDKGRLVGCLAGVRIINNDKAVHAIHKEFLPQSFYSIVVGGVRISTNLEDGGKTSLVGTAAARELPLDPPNERYLGQSHMSPNDLHLIVADPILNSKKKAAGLLVVGIPAETITGTKIYTLLLISLSLLFCLGFSALIITRMSRLATRPITALSGLARDISQREVIAKTHIRWLEEQPASLIIENHQLLQGFHSMAVMLFRKNLDLQESNSSLETSVKERTAALREAVENLRLLNAKKTRAIANISHELRTPLTSIIGFSELLADELFGKLNHTQKEYVGIIHSSAGHLLELINDLLDLNSIERNKLELHLQQVYLDDLIRSVAASIKIQADSKGLHLSEKAEKLLLDIDPLRMRQVLYNIITNAIKFTPAGGRIDIHVFREREEAVITVQDTGIGVAAEDQKHIFDEFYQCGDLYKRKFEGIGVGLPLSRNLVAMHGGKLEFISELGIGTTVRIRLPMDRTMALHQKESPDA